jgi:hypothetical protein
MKVTWKKGLFEISRQGTPGAVKAALVCCAEVAKKSKKDETG